MTGTCERCGCRGAVLRRSRWCHGCYQKLMRCGAITARMDSSQAARMSRLAELNRPAVAVLSTAEQAELLGVSQRTVFRYKAKIKESARASSADLQRA